MVSGRECVYFGGLPWCNGASKIFRSSMDVHSGGSFGFSPLLYFSLNISAFGQRFVGP